MIAIQSLWTKNGKDGYGFNCNEDLVESAKLSANLLKKHFERVVLYTDNLGLEVLEPILCLYDEVIVTFDELENLQGFNWGYSKLYVYSLQTKPFVHVDFDVFIWDGLPSEFLDSNVTDAFFQGRELVEKHQFYKDAFLEVYPIIDQEDVPYFPQYAINCGVVGFNKLLIIYEYIQVAYDFILRNQCFDFKNELQKYHQCILFEQLFLVPLIEQNNYRVDYLLEDDFSIKYRPYTHLIGESKKDAETMKKVRQKNIDYGY